MVTRTGALAALILVASAAACNSVPSPDPGAVDGGPADPAAAIRPDLMVADPQVAAPGDLVALTFPQETTRGVLFVLEERIGDSWVHRYNLTSDGPGPGWEMTWQPVGAQGMAVPDIGVAGPGPDRVPIPDTAKPGAYRICTGNAGDEFCAEIEIAAP